MFKWLRNKNIFAVGIIGTILSAAPPVMYMVARDKFFNSADTLFIDSILKNIINFSCGALTLIGVVMTIHAACKLCMKNIFSIRNGKKLSAIVVINIITLTLLQTFGESIWDLSSYSFSTLKGSALVKNIALCFGSNAFFVVALSAIITLVYTTYRLGCHFLREAS